MEQVIDECLAKITPSLDAGLGQQRCGHITKPPSELRKRRRDAQLRAAGALISADTDHQRALRLSFAVNRLRVYVQRWQHLTEPSERAPPIEVELWHALRSGRPVPTSPAGTVDILRRDE